MKTFTLALASLAALALTAATAHDARAEGAANDEPSTSTSSVVAPEPAAPPANPDAKSASTKAPFREHGRFGLAGALTEDMWKGGIIFEHEHFEAQVLAHAGPLGEQERDVHIIGKVGARLNLGTLNYLALGGEFGPHPGAREAGKNVGGAYQVGPYISLERYFAATPVMMVLWVNPIQYDHSRAVDANGEVKSANAIRVFQSGGFGLAYLFF
jgi:hypothetical protein